MNASIEMTWISNGSCSRPYSARSACTLATIVGELAPVAARVDPAVAPPRGARSAGAAWPPTRIGIGCAATGQILHRSSFQHLAVVLEPAAGGEAAHDVDRLVHAHAALLPRHAHRREVLGPRADADAEPQPVVASTAMLAACFATSTGGRIASFTHERREAQAGRLRREERDERERLDDRLVLEERAVAVGRCTGTRVGRGGKITLSGTTNES